MKVYADILICVNMIIDYFLIKLTAIFCRQSVKRRRLLIGAALGGVSSLLIFLPEISVFFDVTERLIICAAVVFSVFGFKNKKLFLRLCAVFFAVSFAFAGAMAAIWYIFKPNGMFIYNSVVYFDISAVLLVILCTLGYIAALILSKLLHKNALVSKSCEITVFYGTKSINLHAMIDSGNSLTDIFGSSQIIITEGKHIESLDIKNEPSRFRTVPCSTVSGTVLLEAYRCDRAVIIAENNKKELISPILAVSKQPIDGEYNAIINPEAVL